MLSPFRALVTRPPRPSLGHSSSVFTGRSTIRSRSRSLTDIATDPKLAAPSEDLTPEAKEAEPDAGEAAKEMEDKGQDVLPTIT
ncbi:hypothetical protein IAR55_004920 [Kwoniella newhampshirensis]|uniref:Uncharacterized protein n=1 Tax=Kwoniella newhampshirensis TaxID=1651941 RepID=A0AAW0YWX1_9TREE